MHCWKGLELALPTMYFSLAAELIQLTSRLSNSGDTENEGENEGEASPRKATVCLFTLSTHDELVLQCSTRSSTESQDADASDAVSCVCVWLQSAEISWVEQNTHFFLISSSREEEVS